MQFGARCDGCCGVRSGELSNVEGPDIIVHPGHCNLVSVSTGIEGHYQHRSRSSRAVRDAFIYILAGHKF